MNWHHSPAGARNVRARVEKTYGDEFAQRFDQGYVTRTVAWNSMSAAAELQDDCGVIAGSCRASDVEQVASQLNATYHDPRDNSTQAVATATNSCRRGDEVGHQTDFQFHLREMLQVFEYSKWTAAVTGPHDAQLVIVSRRMWDRLLG